MKKVKKLIPIHLGAFMKPTACGRYGVTNKTEHRNFVTCKKCLAWIKRSTQ